MGAESLEDWQVADGEALGLEQLSLAGCLEKESLRWLVALRSGTGRKCCRWTRSRGPSDPSGPGLGRVGASGVAGGSLRVIAVEEANLGRALSIGCPALLVCGKVERMGEDRRG